MRKSADATLAVIEVPWEEAPRFGILNTKSDDVITEFVEKPAESREQSCFDGCLCFTWSHFEALIEDETNPDSSNDFPERILFLCFKSRQEAKCI